MKQYILILIAFFCFVNLKGQVTFQKTYGGTDYDEGHSVQILNDGGYIIAGSTTNFGATGNYGIYLIRTNVNGDTLFTRVFCGSPSNVGLQSTSIMQTSDKGFILTGTVNTGFPNQNVLLLKTDSNGIVLWEKGFGETFNDFGRTVKQTNDGGYIIGGIILNGSDNACLIKTDANGNVMWDKLFGGGSYDGCFSVQQTSDQGFILAGTTRSYAVGGSDIYLIKTNSIGDTLWSRTYGGIGDDEARDIKLTNDGGFIITGSTSYSVSSQTDICLIRTNSDGDTLWTRSFGGPQTEYAYSVENTTDKGFVVVGSTGSFGAGGEDVYLTKLDSSGNLLWSKTYGGTFYDNAYSIQQTSDSGFIMTGYTSSFGAGSMDVYLIKTDKNGNSGCNEGVALTGNTSHSTTVTKPNTSIYNTISLVSFSSNVKYGGLINTPCITAGIKENALNHESHVFPNPFTSYTSFHTEQFLKNASLLIYNSCGQIVKQINNLSGQTIGLYRDNLPNGIFFVKILQDGKIIAINKLVITD